MKIDSVGDTLWVRYFHKGPQSYTYLFKSVINTSDGGLLAAGVGHNSVVLPGDTTYAFVAKVNQNGDSVWTKRVPQDAGLSIESVVETVNAQSSSVVTVK